MHLSLPSGDFYLDHSGEFSSDPDTTLDRLHDGVIRAQAAVVFVVDRLAPDVENVSHTILRFERRSWHFDGDRLHCYDTQVSILKDKPQPKAEAVTLTIEHAGSFT